MTDSKPTTLPIGQFECRVLVASNVQSATEIVNGVSELSKEGLTRLVEHLDRAKTFAVAWYQSTKKVEAAPVQEVKPVEQPKRGGWPKGRSRKRNNPAGMVQ